MGMGYNLRLPALNLTSLESLPAAIDDEDDDVEASALLALVYGNHLGQRVLQSHAVDLDDKELVRGPIDDLVLTDQGSGKVLVVENSQASAESGVVIGRRKSKMGELKG